MTEVIHICGLWFKESSINWWRR